jgi:hypothetical protein
VFCPGKSRVAPKQRVVADPVAMNTAIRPVERVSMDRWLHRIAIPATFLLAVFLTRFASAPYFFLYEDDYFAIGIPATQSLHWVWEQILYVWSHWPQGRPAMFTILALQGALINLTGSLTTGYFFSCLLVSANGYLLYKILLRCFSAETSLVSALFGVLSCADPHQALLTHTPLQFAITLNLAGLLLYLNNWRVCAYLVAGSSLFFYEISFAVFLSAELFCQLRERVQVKRLLLAWTAWVGIAASVLVLRIFRGETRAVEAAGNPQEVFQRIATNVAWGPLYGLDNSYLHPVVSLVRHPNFWLVGVSVLLVASLLVPIAVSFGTTRTAEDSNDRKINHWIALGILILLVFGPYAMQLKRTVFEGFMRPVSGYHLVLGVGLALGAALLLEKYRLETGRGRILGIALAALGAASAYQSLLIQDDYVRSGRYQAHFWSEVRRLTLDAKPGDVILVPRRQLLETSYVLCNSWGITHGWEIFFAQTGPLKDWFNVSSERPVSVFFVPADWGARLEPVGDHHVIRTADYTPPGFSMGEIPVVDDHFIVLESEWSAPFRRLSEPVTTTHGRIRPKPIPTGVENLETTKLGAYIFSHFIN